MPTGWRAHAQLILIAIAAFFFTASQASAAFTWGAPEALPADAAYSFNLAPDGTALIFGFPTDGRVFPVYRLLVRPPGGPQGSPQDLPPDFGNGPPLFASFAPNGDGLIASTGKHAIAFRAAGAGSAVGAPQELGRSPAGIAFGPAGNSLIGVNWDDGHVHVVLRPAGAAGSPDLANAQDLGKGSLVGLALDPDGAAVVVFQDQSAKLLEQAVRPAGAPSFQTPTEISVPGLNAAEYRVRMAADPAGYAALGWEGSSDTSTTTQFAPDRALASYRSPGGAFTAPVIVGSASAPGYMRDVYPGVTSSGDGLVGWSKVTNVDGMCANTTDYLDIGAFVSLHRLGTWGSERSLFGSGGFPNRASVKDVASGGDTIAISLQSTLGGGDRCSFGDNTSELAVVRARTTGPGTLDPADSARTEKKTFSSTPQAENGGVTASFGPPYTTSYVAVSSSGAVLQFYTESGVQKLIAGWDPTANPNPSPNANPNPNPNPKPQSTPEQLIQQGLAAIGVAVSRTVSSTLAHVARTLGREKLGQLLRDNSFLASLGFTPAQFRSGSDLVAVVSLIANAAGVRTVAAGAKSKKKTIVLATGKRVVRKSGRTTIKVRLTARGREAMKVANRAHRKLKATLAVQVTPRLKSRTGKTVTRTKAITLKPGAAAKRRRRR